MSDASQGPGWWLASDGKWYPPQAETVAPPPAPAYPAPGGPLPYPGPGAPPPYPGAGGAPKSGMPGCLKAVLIVGGIFVLLAILGIVAVTFLGRTVADDARASLDSNDFSDPSSGAEGDSGVTVPDRRVDPGGDFCANFTVVNDVTKVGDSDDPAEVRDRFSDFDDQVSGFEASAPPEIADAAATTAEVFRDVHQLLIDVDFDGSRVTEDDLAAIFTPTRSADVRAVSAHCGQ